MAVFKIRMSGEPAELAGIFRDESRTGRRTLSQARIQLVQDGFVYRATNNWNSSSTLIMKSRDWIIKNIHICELNFDFHLKIENVYK